MCLSFKSKNRKCWMRLVLLSYRSELHQDFGSVCLKNFFSQLFCWNVAIKKVIKDIKHLILPWLISFKACLMFKTNVGDILYLTTLQWIISMILFVCICVVQWNVKIKQVCQYNIHSTGEPHCVFTLNLNSSYGIFLFICLFFHLC